MNKPDPSQTPPPPVTLAQAFWYWLKLGFISFGGPAGQIAIMHQDLVEKKRWISERRYLHALNYCMLLPGPEAQQLAIYIGWLMHRTWGGVIAGGLFVLPSLLILIGLKLDLSGLRAFARCCRGALRYQTGGNRDCPVRRLPHRLAGIEKLATVDNGGLGVSRYLRIRCAVSFDRFGGGFARRYRRQICAAEICRWRRSRRGQK